MSDTVTTPTVRERRVHERVYLRDVAAALPADTLVDVVGRAEEHPDGPRRFDNVEHIIVIEPEAYETLRRIGHFPRRARALAPEADPTPRPTGLTPLDVARLADQWRERAERYERLAREEESLDLPASTSTTLAQICRQAEAEMTWAANRLAGDAGEPQLARAA